MKRAAGDDGGEPLALAGAAESGEHPERAAQRVLDDVVAVVGPDGDLRVLGQPERGDDVAHPRQRAGDQRLGLGAGAPRLAGQAGAPDAPQELRDGDVSKLVHWSGGRATAAFPDTGLCAERCPFAR